MAAHVNIVFDHLIHTRDVNLFDHIRIGLVVYREAFPDRQQNWIRIVNLSLNYLHHFLGLKYNRGFNSTLTVYNMALILRLYPKPLKALILLTCIRDPRDHISLSQYLASCLCAIGNEALRPWCSLCAFNELCQILQRRHALYVLTFLLLARVVTESAII